MLRLPWIMLLCISVLSFAGNEIHYSDTDRKLSQYQSDIEAFANLIDGSLMMVGISDVFMNIVIQETVHNEIEYTAAFMRTNGLGQYQQIYCTGSEYEKSLLFAAVVACGITSKETTWSSDVLRVIFENEWYIFSTQECRDIADMLEQGHTVLYLDEKIKDFAYIVER